MTPGHLYSLPATDDIRVVSDNQMLGDGFTDTHKLSDRILSCSYVHKLSLGPLSDRFQRLSIGVPFELTENDQFVVGVVLRVNEQFGQ